MDGKAMWTGVAHIQSRSDHPCPVFHDAKAHPLRCVEIGWQTGSVVLDSQCQRTAAGGQTDVDLFGVSMFDRVSHGLLRNPIQLDGHGTSQHLAGFNGSNMTFDAE